MSVCPTCTAPIGAVQERCTYCGALLDQARWVTARLNSTQARDMTLAQHGVSIADQADARQVVREAILDGLTSRTDAQRSLWAIDNARAWRDLESAIAPALGAASVPPNGTWVIPTPPRQNAVVSDSESVNNTVKWIAMAVALVAILGLSALAIGFDDPATETATASSTTSTTTTTIPGATAVPPTTTTPGTSVPNTGTVPPTTLPTNPNAPKPPTAPAQSAANLARDSEAAKQRLAEVVAIVNELVQTIDASVATLDDQPYPREPGFFDCYPTETDPLPLPSNASAANYARAHAEFYSSYTAAIEGELLGTYATLELEDKGFRISDTRAQRDAVSFLAQKDGVSILVTFENPTTSDPLLASRFFVAALDQCTRVG